jgi:hypothetical protein
VDVGFVVDKMALGQVFSLSISFHQSPLHGKTKKKMIIITELHNKPQGCDASVKSAAGPLKKERES